MLFLSGQFMHDLSCLPFDWFALSNSPSDVCKNCSVVDKSMKIGTNVLWQVLINFR